LVGTRHTRVLLRVRPQSGCAAAQPIRKNKFFSPEWLDLA
jgi:hypothetical protein